MKIEAILNKGPASLGREVDRNLNWSEECWIVSAFVTSAALRRIRIGLVRTRDGGRTPKVRLMFGVAQRFTPPEAIAEMLRLRKAFPGRFFVKCARNNRFHWKLYLFRRGGSIRLYVGSSNFTRDGLTASGELTLKIRARSSDSIVKSISEEFKGLWEDEGASFRPDSSFVDEYCRMKRPPQLCTEPQNDDIVSELLDPPVRSGNGSEGEAKPRLVFVDDFLGDRTAEIIAEETSWEEKGWGYTCFPDKRGYSLAKDAKVLLIVMPTTAHRGWELEFRHVEDWEDTLETPDGKYFLAHSRVRRGWCRNYRDVKSELSRMGLTSVL